MAKSPVSFVSTQSLNHLGLVAGTLKELGIPERIDQILSSEDSSIKKLCRQIPNNSFAVVK
jgi:hypothetical protein